MLRRPPLRASRRAVTVTAPIDLSCPGNRQQNRCSGLYLIDYQFEVIAADLHPAKSAEKIATRTLRRTGFGDARFDAHRLEFGEFSAARQGHRIVKTEA